MADPTIYAQPDLASACEFWQSGRDGSSLLRGAARVLTGIPHYFSADFIDAYDRAALADAGVLAKARVIISAVQSAAQCTADQWRSQLSVPGTGAASRGIASKAGADQQIEALLAQPNPHITMPLWGFSLSADTALSFGSRFVFRLHGPFQAVAAWVHSGIKPDELELIGSGRYRVHGTERVGETVVVDLQQVAPVAVIEPG